MCALRVCEVEGLHIRLEMLRCAQHDKKQVGAIHELPLQKNVLTEIIYRCANPTAARNARYAEGISGAVNSTLLPSMRFEPGSMEARSAISE